MSGITIRPPGKSDGASSNTSSANVPEIPQQNQVLCRNILIHGYCKFADKGCAFRHDESTPNSGSNSVKNGSNSSNNNKKKQLNADSPSFTPSFKPKQPTNADAAPFVPKNFEKPAFNPNPENVFNPRSNNTFVPVSSASNTMGSSSMHDLMSPGTLIQDFSSMGVDPNANSTTGTASPANAAHAQVQPSLSSSVTAASTSTPIPHTTNSSAASHLHPHHHAHHAPPPPPPPPQPPLDQIHGAGQDMIFNQHSNYPLQYHLYAPAPERSRLRLEPHQRTVEDFFVSNKLREELQRKNEARLQQFHAPQLPEIVHIYHSLVPLDMHPEGNPRVFGYSTCAYKAVSNADGVVYCLRRIAGFKLTNERAISVANKWKKVNNPNIVRLHSAFTTRAFGDNSLVCVYDFHPLSSTIYDSQFGQNQNQMGYFSNKGPYSEDGLWGLISQLLGALRSLHGSGLAARVVDPTKVLQTGQGRIRLNCLGIHDLMHFDDSEGGSGKSDQPSLEELQNEDIHSMGLLILCLACNSARAYEDITKSINFVSISYSQELVQFLNSVLSTESTPKIDQLVQQHATRFLDIMNGSLSNMDKLEGELSKEVENGRLVRLLSKFGFINERPEYDNDAAWSDSGERYIIKLFRDYVFHQVDEYGLPVVDLGHVLSCLNKLDAGVDENIMLISRDEQNCIVVSYKELKVSIESAFRNLSR